jgi:spermidine synthase
MAWFFVFFFISGFCSVLYELIWLRLAMAEFGVTTALVSIVLSMFMAGLGAGSWIAGRALRRYEGRVQFPPLRLYAFTELLIGISAPVVPLELHWGNRLIEALASHAPLSSAAFYLIAGGWVALTLIPWCACMGATIPVAMFAIKKDSRLESRRSFSFLYLSNVLGAVAGAILPLFLIELHGFHRTLRVGAVCNAIIFIFALSLTLVSRPRSASASAAAPANETRASLPPAGSGGILRLLFLTGLVTMGMEVIWIRIFTPYIGPVVYSFAMVLVAYLLATFVGSQIYRFWSRTHTIESRLLWISLAVLGVLPLLTADARVPLHLVLRVFLGVAPFAGVIGFLTPMLVDRWSAGDPDRAGRAYAVNVVGCILGPLVSGFILLPWGGEHFAMLMFTLPWIATALSPQALLKATLDARAPSKLTGYAWVAGALAIFCFTKDYETQFARRVVLRDATATVIATGEGMHKQLLINGIGMTSLTPVTKMMAHLTLSSLPHPPQNALIICFGMGTTFRSVLSWGIPATVVELVPSVPRLFWYYHPDADQVLASPNAHVVIDDGRRYLERSPQLYDAIIIDPPPPVQTAGSSLLYSQDFYAVARTRLRSGGILQQWLPEGDNADQSAVARALKDSFPYVRVYHSVEHGGWHYLASESAIPLRTPDDLVARMPAPAVTDMMEWGPAKTPVDQFDRVLSNEMTLDQLIALSPSTPALQDDRPINEYFLLRTPFDQLMNMENEAQSADVPAAAPTSAPHSQ